MRYSKRLDKLEDNTLDKKEDAPDSLGELYAKEDNPETDMAKAMDMLYNPERSCKNPNDAI